MTNLSESDLALTRGLELYQTKWMNSLPTEEDLKGMSFSPAFEKKMKKLIKAYERPHIPTSSKRRITTIILAAIISCLIAGSVYAAREQIIDFFTDIYKEFTTVFYTVNQEQPANSSNKIDKYMEIGYIPEGYELDYAYDWKSIYQIEYKKGESELIIEQSIVVDKQLDYVNTEGATLIEDVFVNGHKGIFFENKHKQKWIIWVDDQYGYSIISNELNQEELMKVAQSVSLVHSETPFPDKTFISITPPYIPQGYTITGEDHSKHSYIAYYENQNHNSITFRHFLLDRDSYSITEQEKTMNAISVDINGYTGTYYSGNEQSILVWDNDRYGFEIRSDNLAQEEVLKIAKALPTK